MADLPFTLPSPLASRLAAVLDVEEKIPRALESLGPVAGREVALLDVPEGLHTARLRAMGVEPRLLSSGTPEAPVAAAPVGTAAGPAVNGAAVPPVAQGAPGGALALDAPEASLDVLVSLWSGFRGVDPASIAEADRVLRPGGRLLVVHDYGRDDVSALRGADAPEYTHWSRRDGPFLRDGLFRVRVLHCFWTFPDMEEAQAFLGDAFGELGSAVGRTLRRPRLSWNVAVYHRWQGGVGPEEPGAGAAP